MFTLRQRIERLEERNKETVLPPIEDLFRKEDPNPTLTKEFVEHMSFSKYPGTKEFSASALKASPCFAGAPARDAVPATAAVGGAEPNARRR